MKVHPDPSVTWNTIWTRCDLVSMLVLEWERVIWGFVERRSSYWKNPAALSKTNPRASLLQMQICELRVVLFALCFFFFSKCLFPSNHMLARRCITRWGMNEMKQKAKKDDRLKADVKPPNIIMTMKRKNTGWQSFSLEHFKKLWGIKTIFRPKFCL